MSSPFGMEVPPASPFGGSLFQARDGEAAGGAPVHVRPAGGSPFTPGGGGQTCLTVADVLPQLPPELARANSLPPDHQICLAPHLIEAALSNGHAAVPIFEIYRVCPAIFQTPVSPQDPRHVPLPAAKLPSLIAATQAGSGHSAPAFKPAGPPSMPDTQQSPFGAALAGDIMGAAPMQIEMQGRAPSVLPPRRENSAPPPLMPGPSFPLATAQDAVPSPFSATAPFGTPASSPPVPMQTQAGPSPFVFSSPQPPAPIPQTPPTLPPAFAVPDQLPTANQAFGPALVSPFEGAGSVASQSPQVPAFSVPARRDEPPTPAAGPSPFGNSPISSPAPQPFALTEPEPPAPPPPAFPAPAQFGLQPAAPSPAPSMMMPPKHAQPAQPSPPPAQRADTTGGPLKLSLATLLKGYTSTDLGFDPGMVPSWIMTAIPGSVISNQMAAGNAQVELGLLIDGTTDIGFRNVLSGARRELKINLPANEVFHGLPSTSCPAPASTEIPAPFAAQPPPPAPFVIQPPVSAVPQPQPTNPFAAAKAAAAAAGRTSPLQPMPGVTPSSGPIQPKPNANFGFATPAPTPAPLPDPSVGSVMNVKPVGSFDPFGSTSVQSWAGKPAPAVFPQAQAPEGFSSEQLFGAPTQIPAAQPLPMPSLREVAAPSPVAGAAPDTFTPLPGIPPPPPAPSAQPFLTGSALQSSLTPSPLPPPIANPFTGPLKQTAPQPPTSFAPPVPSVQAIPHALAPATSLAAPSLPDSASSVLAITPVSQGDAEQVMLRALLGVNENLTVTRVVDLVSSIPGIAACSCVNGTSSVSRGGSSQTAQDFQRQAPDLARNIHALAPLIGISGAETFSINTADRLITFSFHPPIALGVLHEEGEPAAGLRDKITLISRELARMVAKTGGHIA